MPNVANPRRCKSLGLLLLASLSAFAAHAQQQSLKPLEPHLLLAGGGLKICSSMAHQYCDETDWIDRDSMRTDRYLNLTGKYRQAAIDKDIWPGAREPERKEVIEAIDLVRERLNEDIVPERRFQEEFTRRATKQLYDKLSDAEWNRIIDHLEMPHVATLQTRVNLAETMNKDSLAIMQRFAEMAQQRHQGEGKAKVLFVTAGARDSFTDVGYYDSLFQQLGVDGEWLPLDAAVVAAQRQGRCDELDKVRAETVGAWDRARVYPQLHQRQVAFCKSSEQAVSMVEGADGLFFADGSANRIRDSLIRPNNSATPLLQTIALQISEEELAVGGSGAGAAVMSGGPLITNGSSREALKSGALAAEPPMFGCNLDGTCPPNVSVDSLTYHPLGGIQLFHFGSLDSAFSEQGRQARLMRLAATTSTPVSVGIDENTALLVNLKNGEFGIIGERGVFIVENAQQADNMVAANFQYLLAGSRGLLTPRRVAVAKLANEHDVVKVEPTTRFLDNRGAIDSMRVLCRGERKQINLLQDDFSLMMQVDDDSVLQAAGGECQVLNGRMGIVWQPEKQL
ncbi:cyanophycinase [Idiomarina xiamenensis]|uniref:Secreted protein n=1 Tax=Idiomarina xiamenensis 10-D-4 TaxID=740709 RepID=K2KTH3_9GAMM|nr:cyanophycinase [Idiomarina xiamenensis]EKE80935.1 secreted protein [Idiomarina xiamenensis 10-D-4]